MENKIQKIEEGQAEFPDCLRGIPARPKVLYVLGKLDLGLSCVAMVGSRVPSSYGKQAAADIAGGLARAGVCVVSGMAPGIDTICHQTALDCGGKTIGVLGTGLDEASFYPQTNLDLGRKIVQNGGGLASEYPAGTRGTRFTFPQRNRIIAGLAQAVVVVEAKQKSGSLITAEWAKKQGKTVFAVPGSIYCANSKGCNWLLKNGGKAAESAQDILDALGIKPAQKKTISCESVEEQKILEALAEGARDMDEIILATKLPAHIVASKIALMEMNGAVKNVELNIYAINNR